MPFFFCITVNEIMKSVNPTVLLLLCLPNVIYEVAIFLLIFTGCFF